MEPWEWVALAVLGLFLMRGRLQAGLPAVSAAIPTPVLPTSLAPTQATALTPSDVVGNGDDNEANDGPSDSSASGGAIAADGSNGPTIPPPANIPQAVAVIATLLTPTYYQGDGGAGDLYDPTQSMIGQYGDGGDQEE